MLLGIILDNQSHDYLIRQVPPSHPKVFAHHVTLIFKPSPEQLELAQPYLGENYLVEVTGYFQDPKAQAISVKVDGFLAIWNPKQQHHVTISTAEDTPPAYSNQLITCISIPHKIIGVKLLGKLKTFYGVSTTKRNN